MDIDFSESVVLVTGASSGIGAAAVRAFVNAGATVVATARRRPRLEKLRDELAETGVVDPIDADVADPDAVEELVETTIDRHDRLDVAVANAGVAEARGHRVDTIPPAHYSRVIDTNIHGVYNTTRSVLPPLRATDGTLVYTGSSRSQYPSTTTPIYSGSEAKAHP